jgi:hypothetical protein
MVMLTRVGDFAQHQRMTQLLLDAQTRARDAQVQIGTGKVAQRFREVAPDATGCSPPRTRCTRSANTAPTTSSWPNGSR